MRAAEGSGSEPNHLCSLLCICFLFILFSKNSFCTPEQLSGALRGVC